MIAESLDRSGFFELLLRAEAAHQAIQGGLGLLTELMVDLTEQHGHLPEVIATHGDITDAGYHAAELYEFHLMIARLRGEKNTTESEPEK